MNLFQKLRQRRVFRITAGYVVGCWGLLQFLAFLESRMTVSPHLVNLIGLALLLFLPSVITMAWVHGRPGKDTWTRASKIVVPVNLVAVTVLLVILFNGRDLGAVTQTIAVEDENGTVSERVIPKNEYRRRLLIFYPENSGSEDDAWAREAVAFMMLLDVSQDGFVDPLIPASIPATFRAAGSEDGHGLARPEKRKLARDAHIGRFLTGSVGRHDGQWRLITELHESESGKVVAQRTTESADLYSLVDTASRLLREDLGIPAAHLESSPDLPIAEMTSTDVQAVTAHVRGMVTAQHHNDWEGALAHAQEAVERDPHFALAHSLLFGVYQTLGNAEGSSVAISAAMENLYRLPERLQFRIKTDYYYSEKHDADKAMAVLRMWSQIYPDDVGAYEMQALLYFIRQDLPATIAAYEKVLSIDPSRVYVLEELSELHTQLGNLEKAESYLKRYVELFPTRADGYEDLAEFYSATGRLEEARETLAKAELLDPENLNLTLSVIDLDVKTGKYHESKKTLTGLLAEAKTARDRMRIAAQQMNLAGMQGRPDELVTSIDLFHAAMLEVQNPLQANIVYTMLMPAVSEIGRPQEALRRLAEARLLIPDTYRELAGVGEAFAYADLGQPTEAAAALAEAVSVVETFKFETFRPTLALVSGMIAELNGDLDTAITHYRDALDKAIRMEPIYGLRLARALRLDGQEKEAMEVNRETLKTDPAHPVCHLEMAHLELERGKLDKAKEHLDIALTAWAEAGPEYRPAQEARQLADQFKVQ